MQKEKKSIEFFCKRHDFVLILRLYKINAIKQTIELMGKENGSIDIVALIPKRIDNTMGLNFIFICLR
jgi:hypothetical protein